MNDILQYSRCIYVCVGIEKRYYLMCVLYFLYEFIPSCTLGLSPYLGSVTNTVAVNIDVWMSFWHKSLIPLKHIPRSRIAITGWYRIVVLNKPPEVVSTRITLHFWGSSTLLPIIAVPSYTTNSKQDLTLSLSSPTSSFVRLLNRKQFSWGYIMHIQS